MSDSGEKLSNLFQSTALIFAGTIVGRGLGLLGETVVARSLPPAEYGHVVLAYTIAFLGAQLAIFGVNDAVTRLLSAESDRDGQTRVLQHGFLMVVVIGLVLGSVLVFGRGILGSLMSDAEMPGYLLLLAPFVVLYPISRVAYGVIRAEERAGLAVLSRHVAGRVVPLALLAGAILAGAPLVGATLYWLGVPFFISIVAVYLLRKEYPLSDVVAFVPDGATLRRMWSFSWPLAVSTSIFILLSNLDVLMIGYFLDSDKVGYYRAIQPLRQAATMLLGSLSFLFLPVATKYYEDGELTNLAEFYTVSTKWVVAGTLPIVLVFGLFSEDVVRTFFGSPYLPGAAPLAILVVGLFFRAVVGPNGDVVKAIDTTKIELVSAAIAVFANFGLNVALIPTYGISGAALATVVGYFVYNSIEVLAIYYVAGVHPFAWNNVKPLVPTTLVAVGIMHLTADVRLGLPELVGIGIVLVVVQFGSIIGTKSLDSADLVLIDQIESKTDVDLGWLRSMT